jgi:hypothetical protein
VLDHLGSAVDRRSEGENALLTPHWSGDSVLGDGDSEIPNSDVGAHQDVGWLDVSVDDVVEVQEDQSLSQLRDEIPDLWLCHVLSSLGEKLLKVSLDFPLVEDVDLPLAAPTGHEGLDVGVDYTLYDRVEGLLLLLGEDPHAV